MTASPLPQRDEHTQHQRRDVAGIPHPQLPIHLTHVSAGGLYTNTQLTCHLPVRAASAYQDEHFPLAGGEHAQAAQQTLALEVGHFEGCHERVKEIPQLAVGSGVQVSVINGVHSPPDSRYDSARPSTAACSSQRDENPSRW